VDGLLQTNGCGRDGRGPRAQLDRNPGTDELLSWARLDSFRGMTQTLAPEVFPREIRQLGSDGVGITWSDGHASRFPNRYLRDNCPCAMCRETRPRYTLPVRSDDGLHPLQISAVGRYALGVHWSDGHDAGIYSYETLRSLCPCDECATPGDP